MVRYLLRTFEYLVQQFSPPCFEFNLKNVTDYSLYQEIRKCNELEKGYLLENAKVSQFKNIFCTICVNLFFCKKYR